MQILVGLGNPGAKYAANRHNIGWMAVEAIAEAQGFGPWRTRFQGEVAEGRIGTEKVLLLKPTTFMNDSGRSVGEALRFYKGTVEDVTVFHDELDLAPGKLRLKVGGGHAGHNGLRSLHAHIGAEYRRVRLGIGHPGHKDKVLSHVLRDFAQADRAWLDPLIEAIGRAAPKLVEGDGPGFHNVVAQALPPAPKPAKSSKPPKAEPAPSPKAAPEKPAPSKDTPSPFAKLSGLFRRT
ncbi:MAG: aminoacyl-tRNA hydrolase [Pseudomonadota bacterium]